MIRRNVQLAWLLPMACMSMSCWGQSAACEAIVNADSLSVSTEFNLGRTQLGQALAFYDAGNFQLAERGFQAALFSGLPDVFERSSAHKHLAFLYCALGESGRCEQAFDAAFLANPSFRLHDHEATESTWRDAYIKVFSRWRKRCTWPDSALTLAHSASASRTAPTKLAMTDAALKQNVPAQTSGKQSRQVPNGNVRLRIWPWAHVRVDGKVVGVTPPVMRLQLGKGSHGIELSNPGFKTVRYVVKTNSPRDEDLVTVQHDFDTR